MTTGVQGAPGCPYGCPNDSYDACDTNGSREQCDSSCCPAFLTPDSVIAPSGALRSATTLGISPAPWRTGAHGGGLAIVDANGVRIASVRYSDSVISMKVTFEQQQANLRLMRTAPDLLVALEACAAALADWVEIAEDRDRRDGDDEALELAARAIEAARGDTK